MSTIAQGLQAFEHRDYAKAYEILMPFAQSGNPEAQCIIGNLYDMGLGVDQDWEIAADWYRKSMLGGYGVAANNLATIVSIGYGNLPGDKALANELLKEARQLGFEHAPISY
jgi:TPR repeat protein